MSMPDAKIHPTATGKAIKVVEAHHDPEDLVFYSGQSNMKPTANKKQRE